MEGCIRKFMSNPIFRKSFSEPDLTRLKEEKLFRPPQVALAIMGLMDHDSQLSGRQTPPLSKISRIFTHDLPDQLDAESIKSLGCDLRPFSSSYFPSYEAILDKDGIDKTHKAHHEYFLRDLQTNPDIPPLKSVQLQIARDYKGVKLKFLTAVKDKKVERNQYELAAIGMHQDEDMRFNEVLSRKIRESGFESDEELALVLDRCHQGIFLFQIENNGKIEIGTADTKVASEIQINLEKDSVIIIGHIPLMVVTEMGMVPSNSVVRDARVFIHIKKLEDKITVDLVQTAVATSFFSSDPLSQNRVYFPAPSRQELESFSHPVLNLIEMDPKAQIQAVNKMISEDRLSIKLDGQIIENLNRSHFKSFNEETQNTLLYATFGNLGFNHLESVKGKSAAEIEKKLFKAIEIDWNIQDKISSFERRAFAVQLTPTSPKNPTKITITGRN